MLPSYLYSPSPAVPRPPADAGRGAQQPSATFSELCRLLEIDGQIINLDDEHEFKRVRVRSGQRVHLAGQACDRIFVVNSGFLKSCAHSHDKEQVMGFPMRGDLLGVDGLVDRHYHLEVVALTNATLIEIPLDTLSRLGRIHGEFPAAMCGVMSRGLAREQTVICMRSGLSTQARMAHFLLDMAARYAAAGYMANSFQLVMQRSEIGNYLGMAMETVSRMLSELQGREMISINRRTVVIHAPEALRALRSSPRRRARWPATAPAN